MANLYLLSGHSGLPYSIITFIGGSLGLFLLVKENNRYPLMISLLLFYCITLFFCYIINGNSSLDDIRFSIFVFGISILLVFYPINYLQGIICFYLTAFFFFQQYRKGIMLENVFSTISSNYISVLLILAVSVYYIGLRNLRNNIRIFDILPALICFLLSIWAFGRGGILSSLILLVLIVILYLYQPRSSRLYSIFLRFLSVILILCILWNIVQLLDDFSSLGKWKEGSDEARPEIWSAYTSKVTESVLYFFVGAPLSEISIIRSFAGNTHNSFIQLHAYNGFLFFLLFLYLFLKAIIFYFKSKEYLFLIVLLTVTIRGMTDIFIFGNYGMPVFLYFILYPYVNFRHKTFKDSIETEYY